MARPGRRCLRPRRHPHGDPRPAWLRDQGIPFSSFGRVWDDPAFTRWVDVDGHHGTGLAVAHCVEAGYARIGYLGSPDGVSVVADARRERLAGRLPRGRSGSRTGPVRARRARRRTSRWPTRSSPPSAPAEPWSASTDLHAVAVLHAAWRAGLTPGADIGIVGYDDSELARMHDLTSVAQPLDDVARLALELVHEALAGDDQRRDGALLRPGLTVRASTTRRTHP